MINAPILAVADYNREFILTTDAKDYGIGGVLSQIFDNNIEKPVQYLSRTLNVHEKKYAPTHKEALAIVWCVEQCKHYLMGNKFQIRTDHSALKWLMSAKDQDSKLMRWALTLMEYDYEVIHIKGKSNVVADALSRAPLDITINVVTRNKHITDPSKHETENHNRSIGDETIMVNEDKLEVVKKMQWEDQVLKPIMVYLADKILPDDGNAAESLFHKVNNNYILSNGILYHLWQQNNSKTHPRLQMIEQLVIPTKLRKEILYACHEDIYAGHYGQTKTYEHLCSPYFWEICMDTKEHVPLCLDCEMKKFPTNAGVPPLSITHKPISEPCSEWAVDLVGQFQRRQCICVHIHGSI